MDNLDRIKAILKHCIQKECYGCPLRQNNDCVRSMAFTANQTIRSLTKRIEELEKQWIRISERTPDYTGYYIICTNTYAVCVARWDETDHEFSSAIGRQAIAWMPLPEPPDVSGQ